MKAAFSRDALERELEFLVRSLDDLETERAAGDLDDASYGRLRREYIEREAAVRRALDGDDGEVGGADAAAQPAPGARAAAAAGEEAASTPPVWRRRALLIGGIGAFAAIAAVVLMLAVSDRLPGQTASGNNSSEEVSTEDREQRLEAAIEERPDDPLAHLNLARFRLNLRDYAGALAEYDAAAELDPANAEAATYAGWVLYLAAQSTADAAEAEELVAAAAERLDAAIAADPDYPDARAFRGIVRFRAFADPAGAVPDFQQFLVVAPDHPFAPEIRDRLAQAVELSEQQEGTTP